ncbi:hypothetical protein HJG60_007920 [Phyllostomus discolor]|uniref:Uncharacterized protein n=1 Tax=Phyllostomus discolor TaxID=89673 RepID=A0A834EVS2_9CHIR|nr:hypothetical protein HJG60_007920 [Phyllostomus discolor]
MTQYQGILQGNPRVHIKTMKQVNPATYLPAELKELDHDCLRVTKEVHASQPDLQDQPLAQPDVDVTHYMDGSSYMVKGRKVTKYADQKTRLPWTNLLLQESPLGSTTAGPRQQQIPKTQGLGLCQNPR